MSFSSNIRKTEKIHNFSQHSLCSLMAILFVVFLSITSGLNNYILLPGRVNSKKNRKFFVPYLHIPLHLSFTLSIEQKLRKEDLF